MILPGHVGRATTLAMSEPIDTPPDFSTAIPNRSLRPSLLRGLARRCPACGEGRMFAGYLKVSQQCERCLEQLGHIRADDIPPYVTILLVGHLIVPLVLFVYQTWQPPTWLSMTIWPLATLALTMALLPVIKGGVVAVMWSLRLRGDERH